MDTTPHTTGNLPGDTDEYLGMEEGDTRVVAKSLKIPAHLARELDREIAEAGMSFNAYVQNVLMNRHDTRCGKLQESYDSLLHEYDGMRPLFVQQQATILAQKEQIAAKNDELTQKGYSNNTMLGRISSLEREVEEYERSEEEWEKKNILLQAKLDAVPKVGSPIAENGEVGEAKALRRIISEHTFLTHFDIQQLLHEDSDY